MSVVVDLKPCPFCGGKGAVELPVENGPSGTPVPTEEAAQERMVQVCCDRCAYLERVNGRIVDYRCRVTGISFPKYAADKAMISPSTFSCSEGTPKGGCGK